MLLTHFSKKITEHESVTLMLSETKGSRQTSVINAVLWAIISHWYRVAVIIRAARLLKYVLHVRASLVWEGCPRTGQFVSRKCSLWLHFPEMMSVDMTN
jgi:hypothetical protein